MEEKKSDQGMTKYAVSPSTLDKEAQDADQQARRPDGHFVWCRCLTAAVNGVCQECGARIPG